MMGMQPFPPAGSTLVQNFTPSYLYQEYADDENIQVFVDAYNAYGQGYLNYLNNLNLPVYTNANIAGPLLDWVGTNLYGRPRPVLPIFGIAARGPYNTWTYNSLPYNATTLEIGSSFYETTDDVYKRVLTWLFFKGDGRVFTIEWLKRRIWRFLNGVNGSSGPIDNTFSISVFPTGARKYTIQLAASTIATIFTEAVAAGILELPFQIEWTITGFTPPPPPTLPELVFNEAPNSQYLGVV